MERERLRVQCYGCCVMSVIALILPFSQCFNLFMLLPNLYWGGGVAEPQALGQRLQGLRVGLGRGALLRVGVVLLLLLLRGVGVGVVLMEVVV